MLRSFSLTFPASSRCDVLKVEADSRLAIPRMLQFGGLGNYERTTLACLLACIDELDDDHDDGAFFDVGSNVGVFSWLAASYGARRVIAFEPFPALADTLANIAADNDLTIEIERCALGDEVGEATLFLSTKSDCSHSLNANFRRSEETLSVPLDTLDGASARLKARPAIIKIDTETTEPAVLRGATETLASARPWILCEVLPGTEAELATVMAPLDYAAFRIGDDLPLARQDVIAGSEREEERNWLFAPSPPTAEFWQRAARFADELAGCGSGPDDAIETPAFDFAGRFEGTWRPIERDRFHAAQRAGNVVLRSELDVKERLYFFHGSEGFDTAGPAAESVAITPGHSYKLELDVVSRGATCPAMRLWAFQYDSDKRIQSDRAFLLDDIDTLVLPFDAAAAAKTLRIAFQLTGPGTIELAPPRLRRLKA